MIYDDEVRQKYPLFANMSDKVWNRVFKGQKFSSYLNDKIIKMIEEKEPIEIVFQASYFVNYDIWLAIQDYHQLSPQAWRKLAETFSVPDFWQEYVALISGNLDYLDTYFFNVPQSFKNSFQEYEYQMLKNAADDNNFHIVNRLLTIYSEELQNIFQKRGNDIIRAAIQYGHCEFVEQYLKIYPEGRLEAFLNALKMNKSLILNQFTQDEIDAWCKTEGEKIFRNAYLSGNVEMFDELLRLFDQEEKSELVKKYAFDALCHSVGNNNIAMLKKIDILLDTDELRSSILHFYSRKDLFATAVRYGNIEACEWISSINLNDDAFFLADNCLSSAQFNHDLAMVSYLVKYAESCGKIKELISAYGYDALNMGAFYGDIDIFELLASKVSSEDFTKFIKEGIYTQIYYAALQRGHEKIADYIEDAARRYGCWEDIKEQNPSFKVIDLMKQSPKIIQRFLENLNHLEKINYQYIKSYLAEQWEKFILNPHYFLENYPQQFNALMQYAIQTHQTIGLDLLQVTNIEKYENTWLELAHRSKNEGFITSYLKLPGIFDKIYHDKSSKFNDYLLKSCPEECLTETDSMKIKNTLHNALNKLRMNHLIQFADKPIPSLQLSIDFQTAYEMTLFKKYLGFSFDEPIQYPCQQTIDIYRKHGEVNIQCLSENLNQIQAQFGFVGKDPGFMIIGAIQTGISYDDHHKISAFIKKTQQGQGYFCLSVKNPEQIEEHQQADLESLVVLFPKLCEKNKIEKIKEDWVTKRSHLESNTEYYEFNIKADDFHELMLKESDNYRGYRNSIYSVYHLAHPETQYYKSDTMCLFPIQPLDSEMMIRNAGCNVSEVLSVQLSALIQILFDEYKTTSIGGHHQSKIIDDFGVHSNELIAAALMCAGASDKYIKKNSYHEAFDGFNTLPLLETKKLYIQDIDVSNLSIYGVSANTQSELSTLKSFEVPIDEYLSALKIICQKKHDVVDKIQALIDKIQASNVSTLKK